MRTENYLVSVWAVINDMVFGWVVEINMVFGCGPKITCFVLMLAMNMVFAFGRKLLGF